MLEAFQIRSLRQEDADPIARIDAAHGGRARISWWGEVVVRHATPPRQRGGARVGLVAEAGPDQQVVAYLLGQVRAFEFGSEPCGWIYAVGVDPRFLHRGIASRLFSEARERFAAVGITLLRTMVRREDIPLLTFFRNQGFEAGPYVELELGADQPDEGRANALTDAPEGDFNA